MSATDKHWYDTEGTDQIAITPAYLNLARVYFRAYQERLTRHFAGRTDLRVLELGAGCCYASAQIARLPFIRSITCQDISLHKMRTWAPEVFRATGSDLGKVSFDESDFSNGLTYGDASYDVILFDAALHHTRNMWLTLSECRRVIAPGGVLVAQREQYLGAWTANIKLRRLVAEKAVQAGVSENAYLRSQYEYYLRACGFHPTFIPVAETARQTLLRPLNGKLLSKWVIFAPPQAD